MAWLETCNWPYSYQYSIKLRRRARAYGCQKLGIPNHLLPFSFCLLFSFQRDSWKSESSLLCPFKVHQRHLDSPADVAFTPQAALWMGGRNASLRLRIWTANFCWAALSLLPDHVLILFNQNSPTVSSDSFDWGSLVSRWTIPCHVQLWLFKSVNYRLYDHP